MSIPYSQDLSIVIDIDDLYAAVREFGGSEFSVSALIDHMRQAKPTVRRTLRRIHAVFGAEQVREEMLLELRRHGVDLHFSNGGRPDVSVFLYAHRAAMANDVVGLIASKISYLPLLRHIKEQEARIELHVSPAANSALFPAADEVVALPLTIAVQLEEKELAAAE
ncbi:MAG: NYN domain-containing protein [Alphaproteobacteria bacterium]